jgi:hypothetical protein
VVAPGTLWGRTCSTGSERSLCVVTARPKAQAAAHVANTCGNATAGCTGLVKNDHNFRKPTVGVRKE